ncbi:MAG TPA: hypothetical protein VHC20_06675, partial [Candidatus Paceibacterota bacterium]|nr:hypothetical protein [Candidatus Paceibacterota bacterium]
PDAQAKRLRSSTASVTCSSSGCSDWGWQGNSTAPTTYRSASYTPETPEPRSKYRRFRTREDIPRRSGSVAIQCGRGTIRVAATAAAQFEGFCRDLYAQYKFKAAGGIRAGTCSTGSKHPCGGAIDIDQTCRSRGPGHCLPRNFPVALTEQLADKYWLQPGSRWGYRDVGHFEIRGALTNNGWANRFAKLKKEKLTPKEAQLVEAPKPEATYKVASITPTSKLEQLAERVTPSDDTMLSYMAYNEYQPTPPATLALSALAHQSEGSPKEEIARAAKLFGVPESMMMTFARIESDFDCRNKTGSYKGLFQLSDFEFNRYGKGSIWNCRDNAIAAAYKFVVEGIDFSRAVKRPPNFFDRYCVHQQGFEGCIQHQTNPSNLAWKSMCNTSEGRDKGERWCRKAIWGNVTAAFKSLVGSVESLTSGQFVEFWRGRVDRIAAGLSPDEPQVKKVRVVKVKKYRHRYAKRHRHHYAKRHHRRHYASNW